MIMTYLQRKALTNVLLRRIRAVYIPSDAIWTRYYCAETLKPAEISAEVKEMNLKPRVETAFNMILKLNKLEIAELTWAIQEKMGIPASALNVSNASAQGGDSDGADEKKEEKTIFDVKLTGFDAKSKIKVIKEIRTLTGLGLKEAKEVVESAPGVIKKDLKKEDAEAIIAQLKACGASAEMD